MAQSSIEREAGGLGRGQCFESKESGHILILWLHLQWCCSDKINGRCVGSMTLKMRLYKLCRDPCFVSCPHPQCHAEATCVKEILVSCLLMLSVFRPFLSWNLEFTLSLGLDSSHTPHSVDCTDKFRQKLFLGRGGWGVNYRLCSIVLSNSVHFFVEYQKAMLFPCFSMWKKMTD